MDRVVLVEEFQKRFPGRDVLESPDGDPSAFVLVEIERDQAGSKSVALAFIETLAPHYHELATEEYFLESGSAIVVVDGTKHWLTSGQTLTIPPGAVHSVINSNGLFRLTSTPAWSPEDTFPA